MARQRFLGNSVFRWIGFAALAVIACWLSLLICSQIYSQITRNRAERLQAEMRGLTVGKSTWADLQGIQTRWGKWGSYDGSCSEKACDYYVAVGFTFDQPLLAKVLFYAGHSRLASARLFVRIENGAVQMTSYSLWVMVPHGYGPRWEAASVKKYNMIPYSTSDGGYTLIAKATQQSELSDYRLVTLGHPDYALTRPSGCEGCLAIWTVFTPSLAGRDKDRMTDFNFSCITRWSPCKDEEDIMPDAGREYEPERIP